MQGRHAEDASDPQYPPKPDATIQLVNFLIASGLPVGTGPKKQNSPAGVLRPLDVCFVGWFGKWQEQQNSKNFGGPQVLSPIDLGNQQ